MSTNVVKNFIRSNVNVLNNSSSGIYTNLSNTAGITICADNGSSVIIDGDIDISQFAQFNGTATLSAVSDAKIQQDMQQQASQQANAIVQQFAFATVAASTNIAELCAELCTEIQNSVVQVINTNISNLATVTVCSTSNSSIKYTGAITIDQGLKVFTDYVIDASITSSASVKLQQAIDQKATAEMQNFLAPFAIVGFVFMIIIGIVIVVGARRVTKPKFLWTVTGIVIVGVVFYLIVAAILSIGPFKKTEQQESS